MSTGKGRLRLQTGDYGIASSALRASSLLAASELHETSEGIAGFVGPPAQEVYVAKEP